MGAKQKAQDGLALVQQAIPDLLAEHPKGLRNSQVAEALDLRSDIHGRQKDYLTYSVLGGLLRLKKVTWDKNTKLFCVSQ